MLDDHQDREAVVRWLRAVGDASHRLANDLVGIPIAPGAGPLETAKTPAKVSKTWHYYKRQAEFLGAILERGGEVSLAEGRKLAREAGITRGWQVYWRKPKAGGQSLLARDGDTLKITAKGEKRHKFASEYVNGGTAA